jgi:hypothetical protein
LWRGSNKGFDKKGKSIRKVYYWDKKGSSSENYLAKCWIFVNWEATEKIYNDTSDRRRFSYITCYKMIQYHNYCEYLFLWIISSAIYVDLLKHSLMIFIIFDIAGLVIIENNVIQKEYRNCSSYQQHSFEVASHDRMGSISP